MYNIKLLRNAIKSKLNKKNISIFTLAKLSGLSEDTLRTVIYGNSKDIKLSTIIRISDALKCTIDELIDNSIYTKNDYEILQQIKNMPSCSLDAIKTAIKLEKFCLLKKSESNIDVIPMIIPNGKLCDGMYYDKAAYEMLDITEYPDILKKEVNYALKITTNYFEPCYYINDIILISSLHKPKYYDNGIYVDDAGKIYIRKCTKVGLESLTNEDDIIMGSEMKLMTALGVVLKKIKEIDVEYYR